MFLHRAVIYCWYQIHIANQVRHATFHFHAVALQIRHATLTRKMAVFGEANGKWPVFRWHFFHSAFITVCCHCCALSCKSVSVLLYRCESLQMCACEKRIIVALLKWNRPSGPKLNKDFTCEWPHLSFCL